MEFSFIILMGYLAFLAVGTILFYLVVKKAVRDGMLEANKQIEEEKKQKDNMAKDIQLPNFMK